MRSSVVRDNDDPLRFAKHFFGSGFFWCGALRGLSRDRGRGWNRLRGGSRPACRVRGAGRRGRNLAPHRRRERLSRFFVACFFEDRLHQCPDRFPSPAGILELRIAWKFRVPPKPGQLVQAIHALRRIASPDEVGLFGAHKIKGVAGAIFPFSFGDDKHRLGLLSQRWRLMPICTTIMAWRGR